MFGVLLTLLILDGLLLMVIVLLQAGKGGGLAAMGGGGFGTDTLVGGRQAATILTKATWISGAAFLVLALMLSIMSTSAQQAPESVLQQEFQQQVPANPQPVLPGVEPAEPQGGADAGAAQGEPPPSEPR